jgi:hypothetical protein
MWFMREILETEVWHYESFTVLKIFYKVILYSGILFLYYNAKHKPLTRKRGVRLVVF